MIRILWVKRSLHARMLTPSKLLGAATGRYRADRAWRVLADALTQLDSRRRLVTWFAVRRCLNCAADAFATLGIFRSVRVLQQ